MKETCYVLTCECYSGENSVSVYYDEQMAYKNMIAEMEVEITNLQNSGYEFTSSENDTSCEVHVPDSDIYYEWNIEETTIERGYTDEQKAKINSWIKRCGDLDSNFDDFREYKPGQLLEAAEKIDSLIDWDEWQNLQACMGMELSLEMASAIGGMLWKNNIEVLELKTEESEAYYKKTEGKA